MIISIINGSQKTRESNSGVIIDKLHKLLKEKHKVKIYNSGITLFTNEIFKEIISGDIIVLAFPLFVDAVPSHTLKMLIELENVIKQERTDILIMYSIVNNGFYEGKQNRVVFEIIRNWCEHSGVKFGGGIGQGAGEMLGGANDSYPMEKGPFINLYRALELLVKRIESKEPFGIVYLNPSFIPRIVFKIMATISWNRQAYKNGLKKKDMTK